MSERTNDLRVQKTRDAIQAAFQQLILEKNADRITVKELTDRARINRKTFYLHFESIEALYDDQIRQIMDKFFDEYEITPEEPEDLDGHAQRFFAFLAAQPLTTEKLVCNPGSYDFGSRLYYDQMMRYKGAGDPFGWMPADQEELLLHFIRSTALDFYRNWVKAGKTVPVAEAAKMLGTMTCHGAHAFMH